MQYLIEESTLTSIANAIRVKLEGGENFPLEIDFGEFSVEEDKIIVQSSTTGAQTHDAYVIDHKLGKIPDLFVVTLKNPERAAMNIVVFGVVEKYKWSYDESTVQYLSKITRVNSSSNGTSTTSSVEMPSGDIRERDKHYIAMDENHIYLGDRDGVTTSNQLYILKGGKVYMWYAISYK